MRRGPLGRTGALLPVVGQGTWRLESSSRAEAVRALHLGFSLGLTHVDTAELYGRGAVEEIVAEAIVGHRDAIENGTHRLRDVSLDEDTCCIAYPEATLILSKFFFLTRHHIWYLL
jgi:predicted oxidoreductase